MSYIPSVILEKIEEAKNNQLTELDLSFQVTRHTLQEIPYQIFHLENLEKLYLQFNDIQEIPEEILQLNNLNDLNLIGNEKLAHNFNQLLKIEFLNLTFCGIPWNTKEKLPIWLHDIEKIGLDLRGNKLTKLPDYLRDLTNLAVLYLNGNELRGLPEWISNFTNLTKLYLRANELTKVPESLVNLTNLTDLDLSKNQLTNLPKLIVNLTKLTTLYLDENQLTSIPESLVNLTKLTTLYLNENQLTSIPESLVNLTNLTKLDLRDNPLETPPLEIAVKGIEAIRYYFRQLKEGQDYLYEAKLIIVGAGGAGKTTLANKIIDPNYKLNPQEDSTEGIDILKWSFPIINKKGEKKDFKVNIWDFGGQEIYHTTHQFFLTKRSLYALVVDTRKEDTDFPYWLNIVELLSDRSPLIIIKNEKGDRTIQINERQLKGQFESLQQSFSTNLANINKTKNEDERYEQIIKSCKYYFEQLPHIGDVIPKTWKQVRDKLEKDKRNYISLDEYLNICEENEFKNYEDKMQLSGYLHDLGVILHFKEDLYLEKTVILKPDWGTDAVYKVLDNTTVINNLGQFSDRELKEIWKDEQYAGKRIELLQLMKKFQLCYELPQKVNNYIAPQLLSLNNPEYSWNNDNNLLLRYDYEFMPKGIITRFIVVVHDLIEKQQLVWRNGVILDKDETRAEIIEFYDGRKIFIRVSGKNRKELMTIVTYELDKIHKSYENRLKVDKLIPCNCSICTKIEEPYFYRFQVLKNFKEKGVEQIQCQKSAEMVDILRLTENIFVKQRQDLYKEKKMGINKLIQIYERRLQLLKEQKAMKGADCPPHITMEIEDIEGEINNLKQNISPIYQMDSIELEAKIKKIEAENKQLIINRNINISGGTINASGAGAMNLGDNYGTITNTVNQNPSGLTVQEISKLIKELESAIASAELPEKEIDRFKRNIKAIEAELVDEPDKEEVKDRLESITKRINKLTGTIDAADKLKDKVVPIIEKIAPWLGLAVSSFF